MRDKTVHLNITVWPNREIAKVATIVFVRMNASSGNVAAEIGRRGRIAVADS